MFNIVLLCVIIIIAYRWTKAIDDIKNLHPDYEGEDFP